MARVIPFLAAITIVISSGVAHGLRTGRWATSRDRGSLSRLDRIPMEIGDWRGRIEAMDPREIAVAGLDGCLMRRYEDRRTGRAIRLFIACGRPGPVSVHTPDVCYMGGGYQMAQSSPAKISFRPDNRQDQAEFLQADFDKQGSLPPERLHISWSWSATGAWRAPENPRFVFGLQPVLYKLYVVHRTSENLERIEDDPCIDFLRQLVPELEKALFGGAPNRVPSRERRLWLLRL